MLTNYFTCLLTFSIWAYIKAEFNFTKCPAYWELQSSRVAKNFNINKVPGTYYELAFHDYTQYPICLKPSCIRAEKSFVPESKVEIPNS